MHTNTKVSKSRCFHDHEPYMDYVKMERLQHKIVSPVWNTANKYPSTNGKLIKSSGWGIRRSNTLPAGFNNARIPSGSGRRLNYPNFSFGYDEKPEPSETIENIIVPVPLQLPSDDLNLRRSSTAYSFCSTSKMRYITLPNLMDPRTSRPLTMATSYTNASRVVPLCGERYTVSTSLGLPSKTTTRGSCKMLSITADSQSRVDEIVASHRPKVTSEQMARFQEKSHSKARTRVLKRTSEVMPHRVNRCYYMSGSPANIQNRYSIGEHDMMRLQRLQHVSSALGHSEVRTSFSMSMAGEPSPRYMRGTLSSADATGKRHTHQIDPDDHSVFITQCDNEPQNHQDEEDRLILEETADYITQINETEPGLLPFKEKEMLSLMFERYRQYVDQLTQSNPISPEINEINEEPVEDNEIHDENVRQSFIENNLDDDNEQMSDKPDPMDIIEVSDEIHDHDSHSVQPTFNNIEESEPTSNSAEVISEQESRLNPENLSLNEDKESVEPSETTHNTAMNPDIPLEPVAKETAHNTAMNPEIPLEPVATETAHNTAISSEIPLESVAKETAHNTAINSEFPLEPVAMVPSPHFVKDSVAPAVIQMALSQKTPRTVPSRKSKVAKTTVRPSSKSSTVSKGSKASPSQPHAKREGCRSAEARVEKDVQTPTVTQEVNEKGTEETVLPEPAIVNGVDDELSVEEEEDEDVTEEEMVNMIRTGELDVEYDRNIFSGVRYNPSLDIQPDKRAIFRKVTRHLVVGHETETGVDENDKEILYINPNLSEEQTKTFLNFFDTIDVNSDGRISLEELQPRLFNNLKKKDLPLFLRTFDLNGDKTIDSREFLAVAALNDKLCNQITSNPHQEWNIDLKKLSYYITVYKEMFQMFDFDQDGRVTLEELMVIVAAGLDEVTGTDVTLMSDIMTSIDRDGNGYIEFVEYLTYIPFFLSVHSRLMKKPMLVEDVERARCRVHILLQKNALHKYL